ncbi:MAG: hypothetical protein EXR67_06295 [Dehalococcoidia bacterium]|nr:hypothetical protein [Dehalococcoidia bacterium]
MSTNKQPFTFEELQVRAKAAGLQLTPEQLQHLYDEASELIPRLMRLEQAGLGDAEPDSLHTPPVPPRKRTRRS